MSACGCGDSFCNECNGASRLVPSVDQEQRMKLAAIDAVLREWEARQPPRRDGKPAAAATLRAIRKILEGAQVSDHVVSRPSTEAEIQASDNKVIKDNYNAAKCPIASAAKEWNSWVK